MRVAAARFFVMPSEVEGPPALAAACSMGLLDYASLRSESYLTNYEKNRNTFRTGTKLSAGVCRAGESENRRQRDCGGVRENRQGDAGGAVRIRCGSRSDLAGRAILSRMAEERRANRYCRCEQPVLVERR